MRFDILSEDQCHALAKLQDNVKAFNAQKGVEIIHQELGHENMKSIQVSPEPFAAGSLCQVYRASRADGSELAIKVKRPMIELKLYADTFFLKSIQLVLYVTGIGEKIGVRKLIDEIIEMLRNELDYKREARHLEIFSSIGKRIKGLVVPNVSTELCTRKVLTMDYLKGIPLSEYMVQEERERKHDRKELCEKIYNIYLQSIFSEGTFHADPHPGNIFILDDGQIGIVDFGIIGVLNANLRQKNFNYLLALSSSETEKAAEIYASILLRTAESNLEGLLKDTKLELDLHLKRLDDLDRGIGHKSSASLYMNSIAYARKYKFKFPDNVFLFYKTMFTLDSVLLKLDPDFDSKKQTAKLLGKITMDKLVNEFSYQSVLSKFHQIPEMIAHFPDLISFLKREKESSQNQKSTEDLRVPNTEMQYLSMICLLIAFISPIFYWSDMLRSLSFSFWHFLGISIFFLLISIRLKR